MCLVVVCFAATQCIFLHIPFSTIKKHKKTHKNEVTIRVFLIITHTPVFNKKTPPIIGIQGNNLHIFP